MTSDFNKPLPGATDGSNRIVGVGRSDANVGNSLRKRRRWYAEGADGDGDDPDNGSEDGDADDDPPGEGDGGDDLPDWVRKKLDKANKEAERYRIELRKKEEAEAKKAKADAEKRGEFQTLYEQEKAEKEQLLSYKEEVERLRGEQSERNKTRIGALSKDNAKIIQEMVEGLGLDDPYKVRDFLDKQIALLERASPPNMDGGARGDKSQNKEYLGSEDHKKAVKKRYRINR